MPIEPYEMPEEIEIEKVLTAFKKYSNYDFSDYSDKSFARRVEKILVDHGLSIDLLVNRMASNPQFLEQVVREITVNTTELFRDIDFWQAIKYRILPKLKRQDCIRIWHAGCSTGQEVYSMAIILHELGLSEKTYLLASDINTDVIQRAKNGIYQYRFNRDYLDNFDKVMRYNPYNYEEVFNIPDEKYFTINQSTDTLSLHKFLIKNVEFVKHDLVKLDCPSDQPFDIIICRNVLIYFNFSLQNRIIDTFYDNLNTRGFLVLGKHESLLGPKSIKFNKRGVFYTKKNII